MVQDDDDIGHRIDVGQVVGDEDNRQPPRIHLSVQSDFRSARGPLLPGAWRSARRGPRGYI
jgi:hypothetical protein